MDKESVSFWADIKKYEDMLANDPKSYCFTLLSELYRKLGLLDDAINVANRGIEIHPEYVGGYMAVGRASFEKGMKEESKKALERVVRVTPDNLLAQKLLSQIYIEQGDISCAIKTLQVIELLNPEDVESRLMLEALNKSAVKVEGTAGAEVLASLLPEEDVCGEQNDFVFIDGTKEAPLFDRQSENVFEDQATDISTGKGPLATGTLAELYASQGFLDRAINVYQELLENEPDNEEYKARLMELSRIVSGLESRYELQEAEVQVENLDHAILEDRINSLNEIHDFTYNSRKEDRIISVLECWLDNIKRGRYATEGNTQEHR